MHSRRMPLHNEKNIIRVMNIVNPADIKLVYRDYGYGGILEEDTYEFANCALDDNFFIVQDMIHSSKEPVENTITDDISENTILVDELCMQRNDEDTDLYTRQSDDDSISCFFRELDESERVISGLSSSRLLVELDSDVTSCSSSILTNTSYTRRQIPETMRNSLRYQLGLLLEQSENMTVEAEHETTVEDTKISKLKVRKRVLERSCHQENFLNSLRATNSRIVPPTSW